MDVVLLFPGQGSQRPGMGRDLAESFEPARRVFAGVDEAVGAPVSTLCFDGPADELTLTHNAQPALLAHAAAVWAVVAESLAPHVRAAAGHSLGEFTAYHAAGALDLPRAARLVRTRGELMYDTGRRRPGAMAAILGELTRPVESICEQASAEAGQVVPANYNSPEQVVISGETDAVERAMALARAAGAKRTLRLPVSGAFHSPLMEPAREGLREAIRAAELRDPAFPIFSNVSETATLVAGDAGELLLEQLTAPVRWTGVVRNLGRSYPGALFLELGPGNVLSGLVRRILPGASPRSCGTAAEVNSLLGFVS